MIRLIILWGLYWGPLCFGNYHLVPRATVSFTTSRMLGALGQDCRHADLKVDKLLATDDAMKTIVRYALKNRMRLVQNCIPMHAL